MKNTVFSKFAFVKKNINYSEFVKIRSYEQEYLDWFFFEILLRSFSKDKNIWLLVNYWKKFINEIKLEEKQDYLSVFNFTKLIGQFYYITYFFYFIRYLWFFYEGDGELEKKVSDEGIINLKRITFELKEVHALYSTAIDLNWAYYNKRISSFANFEKLLWFWTGYVLDLDSLKTQFCKFLTDFISNCLIRQIFILSNDRESIDLMKEVLDRILMNIDSDFFLFLTSNYRIYYYKCHIVYELNQNFEENKMLGFVLGIIFMDALNYLILLSVNNSGVSLENAYGMKNVTSDVLNLVQLYIDFLVSNINRTRGY